MTLAQLGADVDPPGQLARARLLLEARRRLVRPHLVVGGPQVHEALVERKAADNAVLAAEREASKAAGQARDALATTLYSKMFNWYVCDRVRSECGCCDTNALQSRPQMYL